MSAAKTSSSGSKSKSRFSTGSKFVLKSTGKKKRSHNDKIDLEDSGVQLDEPASGQIPAVSLEVVDVDIGVCLRQDDSNSHSTSLSSQMTQQSGHIPTPLFTKHCAISAPDLTSTDRISKSESPQPPPKYMSPSGATLQPPEQHLGISLSRDSTSASSKHISALEPRHTPVFSLGVDSDEELEPIRQRRESNASRTSRTSRDTRSREKSRHKDRFKKILKPLRRSHSAGSTKDVPAHALFLRHDITKERKTPIGINDGVTHESPKIRHTLSRGIPRRGTATRLTSSRVITYTLCTPESLTSSSNVIRSATTPSWSSMT
ncbi:hypothetical protein LSH36_22g01021 [Paralvinella palmiformis]|uniref:Uncharacterized protein n=1 Tax=Paralvinella palmiformis TaxID=53620 RepID=A0AAD9KB36_9ANNE|nr:hypothetical protein LSH36_22g01021 [Paralvinella palmiformis]